MTVIVDDVDKEILKILQRNCRIKLSKLSEMIDKPRTTVAMRIKRLEDEGLICSYKAMINPAKLGFTVLAYVLISVKRIAPSQGKSSQVILAEKIIKDTDEDSSLPWVEEAEIITGPYDIVLKVWARDIQQLSHFLINYLPSHPEIQKTETMLVLEKITDLRDRELPLLKVLR